MTDQPHYLENTRRKHIAPQEYTLSGGFAGFYGGADTGNVDRPQSRRGNMQTHVPANRIVPEGGNDFDLSNHSMRKHLKDYPIAGRVAPEGGKDFPLETHGVKGQLHAYPVAQKAAPDGGPDFGPTRKTFEGAWTHTSIQPELPERPTCIKTFQQRSYPGLEDIPVGRRHFDEKFSKEAKDVTGLHHRKIVLQEGKADPVMTRRSNEDNVMRAEKKHWINNSSPAMKPCGDAHMFNVLINHATMRDSSDRRDQSIGMKISRCIENLRASNTDVGFLLRHTFAKLNNDRACQAVGADRLSKQKFRVAQARLGFHLDELEIDRLFFRLRGGENGGAKGQEFVSGEDIGIEYLVDTLCSWNL